MAFIYSPPYIEREHCKGTKKGTFLPTMKGLKGTKTRVRAHVPGVKPAESSFRMVINPFRVERERKKTSKDSPKIAPYSLPLYREHCKGTKKGTFLPTRKGSKGTKAMVNTHVPSGEEAKSSFGRVRNPTWVERKREKKLRKFHPKIALYGPPIYPQ